MSAGFSSALPLLLFRESLFRCNSMNKSRNALGNIPTTSYSGACFASLLVDCLKKSGDVTGPSVVYVLPAFQFAL